MEALGIDPKLLVAQLVNFALFAYVFKRFMYKPFKTNNKAKNKKGLVFLLIS